MGMDAPNFEGVSVSVRSTSTGGVESASAIMRTCGGYDLLLA